MILHRLRKMHLIINRTLSFRYVMLFFTLYLLISVNPIFGNSSKNGVLEDIGGLKIPICEGNEELKRFSLKNGKIHGVSYQVAEPFPARKVIGFYKQEMRKLGFFEISTKSDKIKLLDDWQRYVDSTTAESFDIAEYTIDWADKKKSARLKLILRYKTLHNENKEQIVNYEDWLYLKVIIQKMPFFLLPGEKTESDLNGLLPKKRVEICGATS